MRETIEALSRSQRNVLYRLLVTGSHSGAWPGEVTQETVELLACYVARHADHRPIIPLIGAVNEFRRSPEGDDLHSVHLSDPSEGRAIAIGRFLSWWATRKA